MVVNPGSSLETRRCGASFLSHILLTQFSVSIFYAHIHMHIGVDAIGPHQKRFSLITAYLICFHTSMFLHESVQCSQTWGIYLAPALPPLNFWNYVSHWTQSTVVQSNGKATELQGPICLPLTTHKYYTHKPPGLAFYVGVRYSKLHSHAYKESTLLCHLPILPSSLITCLHICLDFPPYLLLHLLKYGSLQSQFSETQKAHLWPPCTPPRLPEHNHSFVIIYPPDHPTSLSYLSNIGLPLPDAIL